MMIFHQQLSRPNAFGGMTNTTLCGRMSNQHDDMNVDAKVTCKLCLKRLALAQGRKGTG